MKVSLSPMGWDETLTSNEILVPSADSLYLIALGCQNFKIEMENPGPGKAADRRHGSSPHSVPASTCSHAAPLISKRSKGMAGFGAGVGVGVGGGVAVGAEVGVGAGVAVGSGVGS